MQETHHLLLPLPTPTTTKLPKYPSKPAHLTATSTAISLPQQQQQQHTTTKSLSISTTKSNAFEENLLYLDSLGIDLLALLPSHPQLLATPLPTLRAAASFLLSPAVGLTPAALRRVALLCPEALTLSVPRRLSPVVAFLLDEALVPAPALPGVLLRRPRILASPVPTLLRPTLLFLRSLGIPHPHRHPTLLTSSVEAKLLPRLRFLHRRLGFSPSEAAAMLRRFPPLFCYSPARNLQPKFDYFVLRMARHPRELRAFPHYFSFSLHRRIVPRHRACLDRGVCFPLPLLLRSSEEEFLRRLDLCCEASLPRPRSPLWRADYGDDDRLLGDSSLS